MIYELVYTSAPRGLFPGNTGFSVVACTRNIDMVLCRQLEKLSAYTPYYAHYDAKAHLNPVNYAHRVVSVRNVEYHVLSRICFNGLDYTQRSNKLASHIAISSDELSRYPNGPADLFQQRGLFKDESWTIATGYLEQPPCIQPVPPRNKICATWKHFTGDAGWGGVLAETYLNNPGKTIYVVFAPENAAYNLALAMEALELLPPSQRWSVAFSTYFTEVTPGTPCNWRFCTPDSPHLQRAKENPAANFILDLTQSLGNAPNGRLVETARTGIEEKQPLRTVKSTDTDLRIKDTPVRNGNTTIPRPANAPRQSAPQGNDFAMKAWAAAAVILLNLSIFSLIYVYRTYDKKLNNEIAIIKQLEKQMGENKRDHEDVLELKEEEITQLKKDKKSMEESHAAERNKLEEDIKKNEEKISGLSQKEKNERNEKEKYKKQLDKLTNLLDEQYASLLKLLQDTETVDSLKRKIKSYDDFFKEKIKTRGDRNVIKDKKGFDSRIDELNMLVKKIEDKIERCAKSSWYISIISMKYEEIFAENQDGDKKGSAVSDKLTKCNERRGQAEKEKVELENLKKMANDYVTTLENIQNAKIEEFIEGQKTSVYDQESLSTLNGNNTYIIACVLPEDKCEIKVTSKAGEEKTPGDYLDYPYECAKLTVTVKDKDKFMNDVKQVEVVIGQRIIELYNEDRAKASKQPKQKQ